MSQVLPYERHLGSTVVDLEILAMQNLSNFPVTHLCDLKCIEEKNTMTRRAQRTKDAQNTSWLSVALLLAIFRVI